MNRLVAPIVLVVLSLNLSPTAAASWDKVVLRDDFASPGIPDPAIWIVNHPGIPWWVQGRTHFPDPSPWLPTGEYPRVEDGVCIIEHHLYNPYDLASVNTTFLGGEIHTIMEFQANRCYRFEARVKCYSDQCYSTSVPCVPYPDGLVTSFFTYGYDGQYSDEIDYEFLSRLMNDNTTYPNSDPFLTNTWNESFQLPECIAPAPDGLDLVEWNTFRIYWFPVLHRVDWTWMDPVNGETLLRTETNPFFVPDEPMALYFNFWSPPGPWDEPCYPYDAGLQPVSSPELDEISGYEIDYVEVRTISGDWDGDGDVDIADFTEFPDCLSGPSAGADFVPPTANCLDVFDYDGDSDVDLVDFGGFVEVFSVP